MPPTLTERQIRQLGALLHDIGKFEFRARPLEPGQTHEHLGNTFIHSQLSAIDAFAGSIREIADAAKRPLEIYVADATTARGERQEQTELSPDAGAGTRRYLIAIPSRVQILLDRNQPKAPLPRDTWYIEPRPLQREAPMPKYVATPSAQWSPDESETIQLHAQSWQQFCEELRAFSRISDPWAAIETLYSLLEKYTATVTSAAYFTLPDITLFDHSRVVAALSHCIAEGTRDTECLLVTGDLSGIQRFLYSNVGHAAQRAKLLRGRSLLVRLVCDSVVAYLLRALDLYRSNVLYSGGGNFELLVPYTSDNCRVLEEAQHHIARAFAHDLGFALQLSFAVTRCSARELFEDYAAVRTRVGAALNKKKRKRFAKSLDIVFSQNELPSLHERLDRLCIELGDAVPKAQYLVELHGVREQPSTGAVALFQSLGIGWVVADEQQVRQLLQRRFAERAIVHRLDDTALAPIAPLIQQAAMPTAASFRLSGSHLPRRTDGSVCTFEELAQDRSENYPLLAFARMDLDSLGLVMRTGLHERTPAEKKYTISRIASLSRSLDHFFCGTVPVLAQQHRVYLVYAGGDDLFAVGSWIAMLDFVTDVRRSFEKFVCGNRNLTLSCGIAIAKPHFPIDRAAEEAGRLEDVAKHGFVPSGNRLPDAERLRKDRVALLDCAMEWRTFQHWLDFGRAIEENIRQQTAAAPPRTFVHRLLELTRNAFDYRGGLRVRSVAAQAGTIAQLRYALARRGVVSTAPQTDQNWIYRKLAECLLDISPTDRVNNWWNFRLVASYVLWRTRSNN